MAIVIIIIALIMIGLSGYAGFYIGTLHIKAENEILKKNISHLERFSSMWASEAAGAYQLSNQVSQMQSQGLASTMQIIAQILSAYQMQNATNLSNQQNEDVSRLIKQARALSGFQE